MVFEFWFKLKFDALSSRFASHPKLVRPWTFAGKLCSSSWAFQPALFKIFSSTCSTSSLRSRNPPLWTFETEDPTVQVEGEQRNIQNKFRPRLLVTELARMSWHLGWCKCFVICDEIHTPQGPNVKMREIHLPIWGTTWCCWKMLLGHLSSPSRALEVSDYRMKNIPRTAKGQIKMSRPLELELLGPQWMACPASTAK